ncbi:GntR family transcriptional regulator [uncultured Piscinibacter sp.]|uniref:GntR family transcriptional regulator n=1 Tax=uncultured Piscinibacter sp. TaxID=1131835 RepID=UPI00260F3E34|nr:GntR family transcriptional regulator [uncultured Piscinibacter sp.]
MPRPPRAMKSADPNAPESASDSASDRGPSVEHIAQDIATAIIEKRLPPGTWLREEALGRVYAVSRTKIRGALLMLAKDKLVETVPDKGSFVSKPSVQEAREVFSVRRLLESEVVRLFCARATAADYERLEQHVRIERSTLRGPSPGSVRERLLGDFHVVLAEACGHRVLAELVAEQVARSSLIAMLYQSSNDPHCSSDEHADFLALCRRGDVEAAVRSMVGHLSRVESSLRLDQDAPDRQLDLVKALLT